MITRTVQPSKTAMNHHLYGVGQTAGVLHGVGCQGGEVLPLDQAAGESSQVLGDANISGKLTDLRMSVCDW